ncbi:MAG: hypothetical protein CMC55_06575 [Flavobacteriaceae bacterium]|nr:hypothetical protein [Flavobacteriaceae bacterium]
MNSKILDEMQETLNQLKEILKEQKEDIIILIKEQEKKEKIKREYNKNIEEYIKYNNLKTLNDLNKIRVKENDKIFKQKINHSISMINEIHKSKFNNEIVNNLEDFVSI